jgi:hypothetical protein
MVATTGCSSAFGGSSTHSLQPLISDSQQHQAGVIVDCLDNSLNVRVSHTNWLGPQ